MTEAALDAREPKVSTLAGLAEIYRHLSGARRRQFYFLLVLMLLGAVAELGTIGSVVPFLAILAGQAPGGHLAWLTTALGSLGVGAGAHNLIIAGLIFVTFVLLAGALRLELTWVMQNFTHRLAHDLTIETQRRILAQPYAFHIQRNSSLVVSSVDMVEILVLEVVLPLMQTLTAGLSALVIMAALIYMDPFTAIVGGVTFAMIYIAFSVASGKRLARNSAVLGESYERRVNIIQESIGGIRDTIIDNAQAMHLRFLEQVSSRLADARATTAFIALAPRYLIESIGIVTIAGLAAFVSLREGGLASALPFLGALGLGAQRLLPLLQNVYTGCSTAAGSRSSVSQVIALLRLPDRPPRSKSDSGEQPFRRQVRLEKVGFSYPSRSLFALDDISLTIPFGSMLALVGETGSGKTTLADVLMGLLQPTEGRIIVDELPLEAANVDRWQHQIAHVPQSIFLADTTIAKNIALSLPDEAPDQDRIVDAARKAQLHEFIVSLPAGYDTRVGERGVRLSGGQRQRLGIARAIYKGAPVLVLDEATSALDEQTESSVITALDGLRREGCTIIIVAHRASTIRCCDLVARLSHGRLLEFGSLAEVAGVQEMLSQR